MKVTYTIFAAKVVKEFSSGNRKSTPDNFYHITLLMYDALIIIKYVTSVNFGTIKYDYTG